MYWWAYRAACAADLIAEVYVATADAEVVKSCEAHEVPVILTSDGPKTGTDRVAEAAQQLDHATHVINLQADEPTITSNVLNTLAEHLIVTQCGMITLATTKYSMADFDDPNCVKVKVDAHGAATAFVRVPDELDDPDVFLMHVGVYGFSMESLEAFVRLPASNAERMNRLEQLRALAAGWEIRVVETHWSGLGVDTPQDLARVKELMDRGRRDAADHTY